MTKPAAIFDLDNTLLPGASSLIRYIKHQVRNKEISRFTIVKAFFLSLLHKVDLVDIERILDDFAKPYAGKTEVQIWDMVIPWFEKDIKPYLAQEAKKQIAWHKAQGHITVMLSAASQFVCYPVRDYLGLDYSLNSMVEVKNGTLTGHFAKPLCYKEGKFHYLSELVKEQNLDLAKSYFYTDSITDLHTLERVGYPVAVNPDPLLKRAAKKRFWTIERWTTTTQ
ncbi:HAD-IB family hydrolase [bacterium]|nr:HAD-IB family hydrolase [bacterium]